MRLPIPAVSLLALLATTSCNKLLGRSADGGAGDGGAGDPAGLALSILSGFEGEIDATLKDSKAGGTTTNVSLLIKNDKVRFDVPEQLAKGAAGSPLGEKGSVILDASAKKVTILNEAQKEALVLDLNGISKAVASAGAPPAKPGPGGGTTEPAPKLTKTGKYDTVAGYKCENWDVTSTYRQGTICVADQGVSWLSLPLTGIPTERAWMLELLDGKHFPLRFVSYAKDGTTEEQRIEVTKINKTSEPDATFQVPAGYKTIDLDKMMQGLGGMPTPPRPPPHH